MNELQKRIGEKIRALRIRRGMTQAELAGSAITRNMLSLIESGNAAPSIGTLTALADALHVPVGYFFAQDETQTAQFTKMSVIGDLRQFYANGEYTRTIELCRSLSAPDDEVFLILAESSYALAQAAWRGCALQSAAAALSDAKEAASRCLYRPVGISETADYLMLLIRSVNAETIPEEAGDAAKFAGARVSPEVFVYFRALYLCEFGETAAARALTESGMIASPVYLNLLNAGLRIAEGAAEEALPLLKNALAAPEIGFYSRFRTLGKLEKSASALGDFRSAYHYSSMKIKLLEQFAK